MARTSNRRWKGCQLCKPWKNASYGDGYRTPVSALRRMGGKVKRVSRNQVRVEE